MCQSLLKKNLKYNEKILYYWIYLILNMFHRDLNFKILFKYKKQLKI